MEIEGLNQTDARRRISLFDVNGLVQKDRTDLNPSQKVYAHDVPATNDLARAIESVKPTTLIGVSTVHGLFTEQAIRTMARHVDRPIIFPLSNPTDKAECTPEQAYAWTDGKALVACGVQFPDVTIKGKMFHPGQANNFYIYPAIGLATYAARPTRLDDECFIVAAHATADQVTQRQRAKGMLYPSQDTILETEVTTAARIAEYMFDAGLAQAERPKDIRAWIEEMLYKPEY